MKYLIEPFANKITAIGLFDSKEEAEEFGREYLPVDWWKVKELMDVDELFKTIPFESKPFQI